MQISTLDCASLAPDLLKRFVPTPFEGLFAIGGLNVLVQCNERAFVELLTATPADRQEGRKSFLWKLIYDVEASSEIETLALLQCDRAAVANLGPGCLVGVDYERRQLMAFVGLPGNSSTFRKTVLPLLIALTLETVHSLECDQPSDRFARVGVSHE